MKLVIDCSFMVACLLPDEKTQKVNDIYNSIDTGAVELFAPAIFCLECINVFVGNLNKNSINSSEFEEYLEIINQLPVTVDKLSSIPEGIYSIAKLATTHGLTTYDASYLELALRLEAKMVSLDKALNLACKKVGIETLL